MQRSLVLVNKTINVVSRVLKGQADLEDVLNKVKNYLGSRNENSVLTFKGSLTWHHDPYYRPVVGLYVNNQLIKVEPTVRRYSSDSFSFCDYDFCHKVIVENGDFLRIVSMETGEELSSTPVGAVEPVTDAGIVTVDALITRSRSDKKAQELSGFPSFLQLPISDQVDYLFRVLLGRGAEAGALEEFSGRILSNEMTVLDLRDIILRSDEFQNQCLHKVSSHFCAMMVWSGLNTFVQVMEPSPLRISSVKYGGIRIPPASSFVGGLEAISENSDIGQYLARISIGPDATAQLMDHWLAEHENLVVPLERQLTEMRRERSSVKKPERSQPLMTRGVLRSMQIGPAGYKSKECVRSKLGVANVIMYGPYVRLVSGDYGLQFKTKPVTAECSIGTVWLEVIYDSILFASVSLSSTELNLGLHNIKFSVPSIADTLHDSKFEFRFWTDGKCEIEFSELAILHFSETHVEDVYPKIGDLLPLLTIGEAAMVTVGGIQTRKNASGFVFYGPYRTFLPGAFVLKVHLQVEKTSVEGSSVTIEVVGKDGKIISSGQFDLSLNSVVKELAFQVSACPHLLSIPAPLEFRLRKSSGGDFIVSKVTVEASSKSTYRVP